MPMTRVLILTTVALTLLTNAWAQASKTSSSAASRQVVKAQRDVLPALQEAQSRILQMAKAIPADKYSFRPVPQMRSAGEILEHISDLNEEYAQMMKKNLSDAEVAKLEAEGLKREKEITDKEQIIAKLQRSYDQLNGTLQKMTTADLNRSITINHQPTTTLGAWFELIARSSRQLGQTIVYGRLNGILPPWAAGH
jgi:hypothetical protein